MNKQYENVVIKYDTTRREKVLLLSGTILSTLRVGIITLETRIDTLDTQIDSMSVSCPYEDTTPLYEEIVECQSVLKVFKEELMRT